MRLDYINIDINKITFQSRADHPRTEYTDTIFSVASLGWVTPGAATEGVAPLFFSWKTWRPFFAHRCHYQVIVIVMSKKGRQVFQEKFFVAHCFHSGVTPSRAMQGGVSPFLPVRSRFSTILCKFAHNFFSFGCHPLEGVTRGGPSPQWRHWYLHRLDAKAVAMMTLVTSSSRWRRDVYCRY